MHSHVLRLGCYCTCARAGGVSRSRERLGRLRSNLVHGWGPVSRVPCKSHFGPRLHVRTCRMPLPDLRNGWADCVQIWHTASDRLEGCKPVGSTLSPFRTCRAHYLARSFFAQKAFYWYTDCYKLHRLVLKRVRVSQKV